MKENNNKKGSLLLDGGILISLVTIITYILVYSYEYGYCHFFNIPVNLIEINLTSIFIIGSALLFVFYLIFTVCWLVSIIIYKPSVPKYINRMIIFNLPILLIVLGYVISYGKIQKEQYVYLGVILFLAVFTLIFPLITQRKTKGYFNKLNKQEEHEAKLDKEIPSLMTKVVRLVPRELFYLLFYLFISIAVAYNHGDASAMKQTDFTVIKSQPEMVILKKYGDNFIIAKYDSKNKSVANEFSIMNIADSNTEFKLEKIGPLKIAK